MDKFGSILYNTDVRASYETIRGNLQGVVKKIYNVSVVLDAFVEVVNVMNLLGLWDAELAWYSLRVSSWICPYGLEHGFRFCFVSLFNGISTFVGYLMPKLFS